MPCKVCRSDFNIFNWKFKCGECSDKYCKKCLKSLDGVMYCEKCSVLLKRPPDRSKLMELKPKDLQDYLQKHNIPTRGLVEKRELVDLLCTKPIPVKQKRGTEKLTANFAGSVPNLGTSAINDFIGNIEQTLFTNENRFGSSSFRSAQPKVNPDPYPRQPPSQPFRNQNHRNPPHSTIPTPQSPLSESCPAQHPGFYVPPQSQPQSHTSRPTTVPPAPPARSVPPTQVVPPMPQATTPTEQSSVFAPTAPPESPVESTSGAQAATSTEGLQKNVKPESPANSPILSKYLNVSDIKNVDELNNLSSRQLKTLLSLNRVDFKGCVEKSELVERAERLWHDANKYQPEELPEEVDELCKLCMNAPLDCVLLECGHIATCINCGKRLAECPICRQYVSRVVRTFKA